MSRYIHAPAVVAVGAVPVRSGLIVGQVGVDATEQREARGEEPFGQRGGDAAVGGGGVGVEGLEVAAEVEDVEVPLVLTRTGLRPATPAASRLCRHRLPEQFGQRWRLVGERHQLVAALGVGEHGAEVHPVLDP
jgi:hypothetical protein